MAHAMLETSGNPTINKSGSAQFGKNYYCLWTTADGAISSVTLQNKGNANTLTVVISGAPATMVCTDGSTLNGQHTLPPNNPTFNITAVGNFLGTIVTVFNMSSVDTVCAMNAVVAK